MFADAEESNAMLQDIGPRIAEATSEQLGRPGAVVAHTTALKRSKRIMEKVAEKYRGDYSRVCDVARMTFSCDNFEAIECVLEAVCAADELEHPTRIKNRLAAEFDAATSGGYRDVLLNARDRANGHIVEIQITLRGMLAVKKSGGHKQYKVRLYYSGFFNCRAACALYANAA